MRFTAVAARRRSIMPLSVCPRSPRTDGRSIRRSWPHPTQRSTPTMSQGHRTRSRARRIAGRFLNFGNSKVLLTAVEMGLFTKLGNRRLTGTELGAQLDIHPRGIWDFFDALVAMKFLDRDGNGPEARYCNTPAGAMYLDEHSSRYIGGILTMLNVRLFKFWHDLPEALRTGQPQNEVKHGEKGIFQALYKDPVKLEIFLNAMTGLSRLNFEAFAATFDFSRYQTLCDVGGATGLLCLELA